LNELARDRSMTAVHVEYVGFNAVGAAREYTLLVRRAAGEDHLEFTIVIPNEAFLSRRVRYQDAPEICFLKLQRELLACSDDLPKARLIVTDGDLATYRSAHTPPQRGRPTVS
jgi:hypothetical protein